MDSSPHKNFNASDRSYLAILKKDIHQIAADADFSGKNLAEIDLVVSEMASNLIKHGGGGEILVRSAAGFIELICIDNGPGIADIGKMMEDGMSTTNTLGHGLGSIRRLSHFFDIYSIKDWGTILLSRFYKNEVPQQQKKKNTAEVRSVIVTKPGETVCGDAHYLKQAKDYIRIFLGDGLGHGPDANKAVNDAVQAFRLCPHEAMDEIIRFIHQSVKRTRGLVGTIAEYNFKEGKWRLCGVGNIATRLYNASGIKSCLAYNGIIGMNVPNTMKEQLFANEYGQVLAMCSDGIKTRWESQKYPAIFRHDLSIFAAALYKDFARKTDDMSIVVSRIN